MSNNNKDFVSLNTGGFLARHTQQDVKVQIPENKVTGDIKNLPDPLGFAKASPTFKKIEPAPLTEEEKQKAVAENTEVVEDKND